MATSVPSNADVRSTALRTDFPILPMALFAVLLGALFAETLFQMAREWFHLEEMGHGIFVPLVVGYIIWQDRERILNQPVKPNFALGIPLMLWGFAQLLLGYLGADFFVARTAFFVSLVGVILTCCGAAVLRSLWFPLVMLLFMIRLPLFIYSQITFPLQLFASAVAETALMALGIPVYREGNVLELASQKLSVVEACSGIRSLISLAFLSLVYAYFFDRKRWMRWVLLSASVPIAILANATRVTLTGILSEYNKEMAEGIYHTLEGWVIFMVAVVALAITHQVINRVYSFVHARR